ncbi:RNA polymerase sigma factor [Dyadobacter sp. CY323]|uniref:RNA polymerase sigma factor n=1 Tax=Dyadobacter sp. CY323 TaxID=2907302 RepID=UPI001F275F43|nr:sigma-70 family RNA polymerase sigma factor [Dyadobacter sp. CY323]MCE6989792.1 sigma-70 family RNA polymerase sigma factor [Dyadobacter sp. CY323]
MKRQDYDHEAVNEDLTLWKQMLDGDKTALGTLFDIYAKELLTYGYRISPSELVKDAVQDVFVNIWLRRNTLSHDIKVRFYLYRCLRRALFKGISTEELNNTITTDLERWAVSENSAETDWISSESENHQNNQLSEALSGLSPREREVISLKYYSDMKLREIAALLNLKEQTIANTLQNALAKLRKYVSHSVLLFWFLGEKIL